MRIHLLVLNYNGRDLLGECLPSVVEAARASRHQCEVAVIDNDSRDDSVAWLRDRFPQVRVIRRPNRGLCSFNEVVAELDGPAAILLNNDIKLDPGCVDPLLEPLIEPPGATGVSPVRGRKHGQDARATCFMTAPSCWLFDGRTYEGFKTAVAWRWGLVQATARFPGHAAVAHRPGLTASAGAVMAVDRRAFTALGGFDPLYLPGRLEDLDFAFRGYLAGYQARYVPAAVAWHLGAATFHEAFGPLGCHRLALRNTLLFQWKNLRHPLHLARQLVELPARLAFDLLRSGWAPPEQRWAFARALFEALARLPQLRSTSQGARRSIRREREFFRRFHPERLVADDREGDAWISRFHQARSASKRHRSLRRPLSPSARAKGSRPQVEVVR